MSTDIIGMPKWDVDTPALLVDLDIVDRNIATMAEFLRRAGVNWRPHTKGQKVPALAHRELAAGAIGVTCAKLSEAEVMAAAGIRDILIANQVVGAKKVTRLVQLLGQADVIVAVDSLENAEELNKAVSRKGRRLRVLVEVNIGMNRAGVEPGEAAVSLSRKIHDLPALHYTGLMGWEGHLTAIPDPERKQRAIEGAIGLLLDTVRQCREAGLHVEIVSCGGTSTFHYTARIKGVTEIQAGGGIFGDLLYDGRGVHHPFALTILSTVTSRPTPTRVIVDAGKKAMSSEAAKPRPRNLSGVTSVHLSAEHGQIELKEPNSALKVGDKLEWIVGYGDTTVCLHDEMIGIRDEEVEAVWTVVGRGKVT
jgi:D-serine deaminase-like pyridoxal phosphate-dependent protein